MLTQVVLGLPKNGYLREARFEIDKVIQASFETTRKQLLASDSVEPQFHELDAWILPLQLMALYFGLDDDKQRQELLDLVSERAHETFTRFSSLLKAVQEVGYKTREGCIRLMVRYRDCLRTLDSCLVVDPKERLVYYSSGPKQY